MGYSDHLHSDGMAPTEETHGSGSAFSVLELLSVGTVIVLWALFGIAAWTAPGALEDVWQWAGQLPMAAKIAVWVVGLPWMAGLAVWQSDWPDLLRIAVIFGLAAGSIWTFWPKR